jgi:hypothetical protein
MCGGCAVLPSRAGITTAPALKIVFSLGRCVSLHSSSPEATAPVQKQDTSKPSGCSCQTPSDDHAVRFTGNAYLSWKFQWKSMLTQWPVSCR